MLVLSRRVGESIVLGSNIVVTVMRVDGDLVRLGIQAPRDVPVHRLEIYEQVQRTNQSAAQSIRRKPPRIRPQASPSGQPL